MVVGAWEAFFLNKKKLPASAVHRVYIIIHNFRDIVDEAWKQEMQKLYMTEFINKFPSMRSEQL